MGANRSNADFFSPLGDLSEKMYTWDDTVYVGRGTKMIL